MGSFLRTAKGKIIIAAVILLAAAAAVLTVKLCVTPKGYRSISVDEIVGKVIVGAKGKEYDAYKDMKLSDGNSLTTKEASYTRLMLDDDKYVKLEPESRALFAKVGSAKSKNSRIELEYGTLTTEITKPLNGDESYIVKTPNAALAVRGTFFTVYTSYDPQGIAYTNIFTFGGSVETKRITPDGKTVDESVFVNSGFQVQIKMDDKETVYIGNEIDGKTEFLTPIGIKDISDDILVMLYDSSLRGRKLFMTTEEFWEEIKIRNIELDNYRSVYDGGNIPPLEKENAETESETAAAVSSASSAEETVTTTVPSETAAVTEETAAVTTTPPETETEEITETATAETSVTTEAPKVTEPPVTTVRTAAKTTVKTQAKTTAKTKAKTTAKTKAETKTKKTKVTAVKTEKTTAVQTAAVKTTETVSAGTAATAPPETTDAPRQTAAETSHEISTHPSQNTSAAYHEHDYQLIENGIEPTCGASGRYPLYRCTICGIESGGDERSATGQHVSSGSSLTTINAPSCTENGLASYSCSVCNNTVTVTIDALGHNYETVYDNGTEVSKCSRCGDIRQ